MTEPANNPANGGLTRRQLLRAMAAAGAIAVLAGCGIATTATPEPVIAPFPPWHPILPSPQPPAAADTAAATPVPGTLPLEAFLALSALLTGIDNLNPQIGQVYLQSLAASDQFEVSLADLYSQAGFTESSAPASFEEAAQQGIFEQEATRTLADKIIEYWYSGVYDTPEGEQAVATFADALVWRAVRYTKPLTLCGAPGFWAFAPTYEGIEG
jgi:hypothetical protein